MAGDRVDPADIEAGDTIVPYGGDYRGTPVQVVQVVAQENGRRLLRVRPLAEYDVALEPNQMVVRTARRRGA